MSFSRAGAGKLAIRLTHTADQHTHPGSGWRRSCPEESRLLGGQIGRCGRALTPSERAACRPLFDFVSRGHRANDWVVAEIPEIATKSGLSLRKSPTLNGSKNTNGLFSGSFRPHDNGEPPRACMGVRGPGPHQRRVLKARWCVLVFPIPSRRPLRHAMPSLRSPHAPATVLAYAATVGAR